MSVVDLAFIILLLRKVFGDADIEWWIVFLPLAFGLVYDIIELILKTKDKKK